jgi:hypothetical protein
MKAYGGVEVKLHRFTWIKKVKLSLQQAVEAHRVVRRRRSHIFQKIGSQVAVRLSALPACLPLLLSKIPDTSIRDWINLRAIVRLEGLGQLKNAVT